MPWQGGSCILNCTHIRQVFMAKDDGGDFESDEMEPVEVPIDGALDLHSFRPQELASLIPAYLGECRARGILEVRVIHGKGRGHLRRSVHACLGRLPYVSRYTLAPPERGGWGATLVWLDPLPGSPSSQ